MTEQAKSFAAKSTKTNLALPLSHLPRQRLFRAFINWLSANHHRLLTPCRILKIRHNRMSISLSKITSAIEITLLHQKEKTTRKAYGAKKISHHAFQNYFPAGAKKMATDEFIVTVFHKGENWDCIAEIPLSVVRQLDGYVCGLCEKNLRIRYASREALWHAELFEPFLTWVNDKAVSAPWLKISQSDDGGCTWASLECKPNVSASTVCVLPLQIT